MWSAVKIGGKGIYPKTQKELELYSDYVMLTDLSETGGKCMGRRLAGAGKRVSIRPEVSLVHPLLLEPKLEGLLS